MPAAIPVIDRQALDLLCRGRFFLGPIARAVIREVMRADPEPVVCGSCGARKSPDGTLPCGH
jgi:hypothetical protein